MSVIISGTDNFVLNADSLGTAAAGAFDYDGKVFYATPQGTQRGVVPSAQFFRLDSALAGANVNTAQSVFGVGVTLSSSTVYEFEMVFIATKTVGSTSHNFSIGFGGTATLNNIFYEGFAQYQGSTAYTDGNNTNNMSRQTGTVATALAIGSGLTGTGSYVVLSVRGTVSINVGGTFTPQYTLSAAPGGAYTTVAGSFIRIAPISTSGANTNVGTWA